MRPTILSAFKDNAAVTYLASLVPGFSHTLRYVVMAGAVTGEDCQRAESGRSIDPCIAIWRCRNFTAIPFFRSAGAYVDRRSSVHVASLSARTRDQVPGASGQRKEFGLRECTQNLTSTAALPRRQLDEPSFGQLVQQQPGRHVFELSARRAPVEHFAQRDRQPPPTPARMFGDQLLEHFEIFDAQPAPLTGLQHLKNVSGFKLETYKAPKRFGTTFSLGSSG